MTNTLKLISVLSVFVVAMTLSLGAFAIVAHAQEDGGDFSYPVGGSDFSYPIDSGSDFSYPIDNGCGSSCSDFSYPIDNGDFSYPIDNTGFSNPIDNGDFSYPIDSGCGIDCSTTSDYGYTDYGGYEYDSACDCYDSFSSYPSYAPSFSHSYPTFNSFGYSIPSSAPPVRISPPLVQPPVVRQPVSNPTTNTNTNTNTNITNVNNSNNSINNSFNSNSSSVATVAAVTPVALAPIQHPVQYVIPPQPILPPLPIYPSLSCSITASPNSVINGQPALLSWTSSGQVMSAYLSDGIGNVAPNGTLAVRPNTSTMYVLTVNGFGGTRTCNVFVAVASPAVSLTQIPYTGFDFGILGNTIYFGAMALFALALGYLAIYYRGGAVALAGSLINTRKSPALAPLPTPQAFAKKVVLENPAVATVIRSAQGGSASGRKDSMSIDGGRIVINRA